MGRDITKLTDNTRQKWGILKDWVKEAYNEEIFVTSAFRSAKEQNDLYQQGRTTPWKVVTAIDWYNKKSSHQYGIAFDIAFKGSELYPQDHQVWESIAVIARQLGLERWYDLRSHTGFIDKPHFQNTGDRKLDEEIILIYEQLVKKHIYNWVPWQGMTYRIALSMAKLYKEIEKDMVAINAWKSSILSDQKVEDRLKSDQGDIYTLYKYNKAKIKDGHITISVMDDPEEIDSSRFQIILRAVLRNIGKHIRTPIIRGSDKDKDASIKIYFTKNGDGLGKPKLFKWSENIGYWIAPVGDKSPYSSNVYINEAVDWNNERDFWIRLVLEHEILHAMNIGHSENEESLMYPRYKKGDHDKIYDDWLVNLMKKLYW